jgi:4-amino-4-deoxy-L-arabinose transferase-like glycosyltransferase
VLLLILLTALGVRLGWGISRPTGRAAIELLPDQREYLECGRNLLAGKGLHFYDPRFEQTIFASRMPGYPVFIAGCGGNVRVVRVVQAILDASTVLAIYLLARRWLDERASLIAAALVAVNPFLIYFSGLILSETLFTAMLAWGMALLVRPKGALLGVILLVLSIHVRPSGLPLALLLGWTGMLAVRDVRSVRWIGVQVLIVAAVVLTPWAVRNKHVLGQWIFTTTNGGITLYDGFNPTGDGSSDQDFVKSMPFLSGMGELDRDKFFRAEARKFIQQHPLRSIDLAVRKIARTWSPMPVSRDFGKPLYIAIGLVYSIPLDTLVVLAVLKSGLGRTIKVFLLTPALYITVLHALSVGSLRYRIPAEAPMAVMAAAGAVTVLRRNAGLTNDADSPGENRPAI